MTTQHTPGPWVFESQNAFGTDIFGPDCPFGYVSTDMPRGPIFALSPIYDGSRKKMVADARLIAASPELLDLAYQYLSDLRYPPTGDSLQRRIERAEAIIAKATGA